MSEYRCRFCGGWVSRSNKLTLNGIKSCESCKQSTATDQ